MKRFPPITVDVYRGDTVESRHTLAAALVDANGHLLESYGEPDVVTFWRSSAKPVQAKPWVDDGTIDYWHWGQRELAIICASHVGSPEHAELVRRMLGDLGLDETALLCDNELKARHNCSGNHTGMLAASVRHGWDLATYQQLDHPTQQACLRAVSELTDLPVEKIALGIDGCGIVVWATPITAMATAYARLPQAVPRVADAMRAYPVLVEGEGELDTVVMQSFAGTVSKCGAEGLGCVSLPDGRGIALKALDGGGRAVTSALPALVARCLGVEVPEAAVACVHLPVTNDVGRVVGQLDPRLP